MRTVGKKQTEIVSYIGGVVFVNSGIFLEFLYDFFWATIFAIF